MSSYDSEDNLFTKLQDEIGENSSKTVEQSLVGIGEEVGELTLNLKDPEGGRKQIETVGEIMLHLANICNKRGLSLQESYDSSVRIPRMNYENVSLIQEITIPNSMLSRSIMRDKQDFKEDYSESSEQFIVTWIVSCLQDLADEMNYTIKESVGFSWYRDSLERSKESSFRR